MHPGDIVAGKYRVQKIVGRARGLLVEARHTEFDQRVIIRLISPALCNDKEVEQFRREATTLAKLESEHVARIIDVGSSPDGTFYLVRQHLEGVDLGKHIQRRGALGLDEAVLYLLQAGEAVQEAHSHGIIVRELGPTQLFLTTKRGGAPLVKIIDFGTSKLLKDPGAGGPPGEMSATVMFGLSRYSSPELVRKDAGVDARTDVWSLGCIFYEMLTGKAPFVGETAMLLKQILREEPVPLSTLRPDLPGELDNIVAWALAKDPSARFESVYAFAHALRTYASTEGVVLIDQIGRLAHADPESGRAPAPFAASSPLAVASQPARPLAESLDDRSMSADASASLPPDWPSAQAVASRPSAPPSLSDSSGAYPPSLSDPSGSLPPADRSGALAPMRKPAGSWIEPDVAARALGGDGTGGYPAQGPVMGERTRMRQGRMAVVAIAVALVALPLLVVVLIFALRGPKAPIPVASASSPQPVASARQERREAQASVEDSQGASDGGGGGSAASSAEPSSSSLPSPPAWTARPPATSKPPAPSNTTDKPTTVDKPATGGTGTLVAIAIGGKCAFSVDGASKGSGSSISVQVPLGSHTVTCAPKGSGPRSQTVTVKEGKPGMATFKLK